MKRKSILFNFSSAKLGGGKYILENFIKHISFFSKNYNCFLVLPKGSNFFIPSQKNITLIESATHVLLNNYIKLPYIIHKLNVNIIINFCDIIIPSRKKQIYFFDWAYLVYDEQYIWKRMNFHDWLYRRIKRILISVQINETDLVFAQTKNMLSRLNTKFILKKSILLPTPICLIQNEFTPKLLDFLDKKVSFIYPASYSPHKNFEILLPLAIKIQEENLPFRIFITIDYNTNSKDFLNKIKRYTPETIVNLGNVKQYDMAYYYSQADALFFPSLLESYGLPYFEAMLLNLPILTSDLDFAIDVCAEVAFYFNPFDVNSIISTMKESQSNVEERNAKIKLGELKVNSLPKWNEALDIFDREINILLKD